MVYLPHPLYCTLSLATSLLLAPAPLLPKLLVFLLRSPVVRVAYLHNQKRLSVFKHCSKVNSRSSSTYSLSLSFSSLTSFPSLTSSCPPFTSLQKKNSVETFRWGWQKNEERTGKGRIESKRQQIVKRQKGREGRRRRMEVDVQKCKGDIVQDKGRCWGERMRGSGKKSENGESEREEICWLSEQAGGREWGIRIEGFRGDVWKSEVPAGYRLDSLTASGYLQLWISPHFH